MEIMRTRIIVKSDEYFSGFDLFLCSRPIFDIKCHKVSENRFLFHSFSVLLESCLSLASFLYISWNFLEDFLKKYENH